ncbi:MAG: hypothetical protein K2K32_02085 [Muribaculaceae bacterium]|nr:hypothetical protein [Muribaculaceae bacterium]
MAKKSCSNKYRWIISSLVFLTGSSAAKADLLSDGHSAFLNYDFQLASELYDKFEKTLKKSPSVAGEELLEKYRQQLEIAENSLENVQKIEIIDRIDVPAADFFKYIKLPENSGKLLNPDALILKN